MGAKERPQIIGWFSTPLGLGEPTDFVPPTVLWHPFHLVVSDIYGLVSFHGHDGNLLLWSSDHTYSLLVDFKTVDTFLAVDLHQFT